MSRVRRALTVGIVSAGLLGTAVAAPVVVDRTVLGPRPAQPVPGPTGLPDDWEAGAYPFDLARRPVAAASMSVAGEHAVVVAAADGRGYRRQRVLGDPSDTVTLHRLSPDGARLAWRQQSDDSTPGRPLLRLVRLADGVVTEVAAGPGTTTATYAEWTPDGRRLLVAGGRWPAGRDTWDDEPDPVVWEVDAATGVARVLCECGRDVRPTSGGVLVQASGESAAPETAAAPVPPGTRRLPPGDFPPEDGDRYVPLPAPDGGGYARAYGAAIRIQPAAGPSRLVEPGAGITDLENDELLAWTGAGIWVARTDPSSVGDYGLPRRWLHLVDPVTGATRRLTTFRGYDASVATGVGDRVVPSRGPSLDERALQAYVALVRVDDLGTVLSLLLTVVVLALLPVAIGTGIALVLWLGQLAAARLRRRPPPARAPPDVSGGVSAPVEGRDGRGGR
jgi:hypothetical protein